LMEVNAALPFSRSGGKEEVHQERLAAANIAPDVEATRHRYVGADRPQPTEGTVFCPARPCGKRVGKSVEGVHKGPLSRVRHDLACPRHRLIAPPYGLTHVDKS